MDYDLISSYAGLLGLATFAIYAGSFGSLPKPRRLQAGKGDVADEEDEEEEIERMSSDDAWLFPILRRLVP